MVPAVVGTPLVLTITLAEPCVDGQGIAGLVQRRPVDWVQREHAEHERDREGRVLTEIHPSPVDDEDHDQVGIVAVDTVYLIHGEVPRRLVVRVHADRVAANTRVHLGIVIHELHTQRRQLRHASRERRGALPCSPTSPAALKSVKAFSRSKRPSHEDLYRQGGGDAVPDIVLASIIFNKVQ